MFKKKSLWLAFVLTFVFILSACSGNSNKEATSPKPANEGTETATEQPATEQPAAAEEGIDTSKEVKLKMIFVGPKR